MEVLTVPDEYAGKQVKCRCENVVSIPAAPVAAQSQRTTAPPAPAPPTDSELLDKIERHLNEIRFNVGCLLWLLVVSAIAGVICAIAASSQPRF